MSHLDSLPWWIALPAAAFLVLGATLALLGSIGFVRLQNFYDRLHAPTLVTSWGAASILIASALVFSWIGGRLVVHELVIGIFLLITTPVTLMLLGRAALYRDRLAQAKGLPDDRRVERPRPGQTPVATVEKINAAPTASANPTNPTEPEAR